MAKYSKRAGQKVERAMHEEKRGKLKSGRSGKKVTSRKQAIAIGLSEARRAGVKLPPPKTGGEELKKKAQRDTEKGQSHAKVSRTRSRARIKALKKEPTNTVSSKALSTQASSAAKKRTAKDRSASAKKAARTRAKG